MKKILLLVCIFCGTCLFAQKLLVFNDKPDIFMMPVRLVDSCEIDRIRMVATYRFCRFVDASSCSQTSIRMEIGDEYVRQQDMYQYYNCLIYSMLYGFERGYGRSNVSAEYSVMQKRNGNSNSDLFFEFCRNRRTRTSRIVCGDYFKSNAPLVYREETALIKWELKEETDTVAGFICHVAVADFRGRTWTVWYTTDIPIDAGPWKLCGLPGLILRAIDRDHLFSFECLNVSQSDGPMYSYEYENLRNIRTRKRFLKYVQNCHETPYRTFANGEDATVMVSDKMGNVNYLDETWTIPYNPIERE